MPRRHNIQTVSWFNDLLGRHMLDLDPPYQRRSVWTQKFKDYFVDTVLLGYPAPALFVYEEIAIDGRSTYHVVDGKQRLSTLFEFLRDEFPIGAECPINNIRGQYFSTLSDDIRKSVWGYEFLVEYLTSTDSNQINNIFDRINKNVAKLSAQELRHARLDGDFIQAADLLSECLQETFPKNFPRIAEQSRKQMKDVEFAALLMLLIEEGPKGYSPDDLDKAFVSRDSLWENREGVVSSFRRIVDSIRSIAEVSDEARAIYSSRFRNQADFYSLFGALAQLDQEKRLPDPVTAANRLLNFISCIEDPKNRQPDTPLESYYAAARSASNDKGPRETRIGVLKNWLIGL